MAAIIPIAAQFIALAVTSAAGIGGVASALIVGGAALLGAYVANELFGGRDSAGQDSLVTSIRANYVSTERVIPIVYGRRLLGSNDVFAEIGNDGTFTPSDIKYLWVVHVIGEGEIDGIHRVDIEGKLWDEIYIDSKPLWEYDDGEVVYWLYHGTNTQTNNPQILGK